ncbi:MAG: hypothetical protein Q8R44_14830 [Novosphingobium sp.]|nr:hypothetical protein [Novosphingobium sp.]
MKITEFVRRADEVIALGQRVAATSGGTRYGGTYVDGRLFGEFRTASLSLLRNLFGQNHPFFSDFDKRVEIEGQSAVETGLGILSAARGELAGGWHVTATSIVSAEVFSDFLEMAKHLLDQHYKDPAAVLVGGVLEEHLRQLCRREGIAVESAVQGSPVARKADALNGDLGNASAYSKLDQKAVTAWLDLRNKAAHGKYTEYTEEQVNLMYGGVIDFMARNPL